MSEEGAILVSKRLFRASLSRSDEEAYYHGTCRPVPHLTFTLTGLIASLPLGMQHGFVSKMELVYLTKQQIIYEQGGPITHVYFPCSAVVSLIMVMENGSGVEVATIGNDGFLGVQRYFGEEFAFARAIVQIPGESRRMRFDLFRHELGGNENLHERLRRYAGAQLAQLARTAGCNRLHAAEQRCARWLLMVQDRTDAKEFSLTKEMLADMLG